MQARWESCLCCCEICSIKCINMEKWLLFLSYYKWNLHWILTEIIYQLLTDSLIGQYNLCPHGFLAREGLVSVHRTNGRWKGLGPETYSMDLTNLGNLPPKKHRAELPLFIWVNWDTSTQLGKKGYWRSHCVVVCCFHRKLILHFTVLLLKGSFRQLLSHVTVKHRFHREVLIKSMK